jgi:hypothetical protein
MRGLIYIFSGHGVIGSRNQTSHRADKQSSPSIIRPFSDLNLGKLR